MENVKKERFLFIIIIILSVLLGIIIGLHYSKNPSINQNQSVNVNVNSEDKDKDKINLNTASEKVLGSLPEIGDKKAKNIVEYRSEHGNFTNINDLLNVKDIGEKTLNAIKDKVVIK